MPQRIQRRRTKGWRMPEGAVYVGRPSRWGNPYKIGAVYNNPFKFNGEFVVTHHNCLDLFSLYTQGMVSMKPRWLEPLRGKDLACWCPLDSPCHADVLLRLANEEKADAVPN